MKRFLSQREADRCENAKEPACKCRCGGAKHGAGRVAEGGDFSALPMDDPHFRPSMTRAEIKTFLNGVELQVIIAPQPDLPEESWIGSAWEWRHDAYEIIRAAKRSL